MLGENKEQPAIPCQHSVKCRGDETTIAVWSVVKTGDVEGPDPALPCAMLFQGQRQKSEVGGFPRWKDALAHEVWSSHRSPQDPLSYCSLPARLDDNKRDNQVTSKWQPSVNMSTHQCLHCCARCHWLQVETHMGPGHSSSPWVPEAGRKDLFWGGLSLLPHFGWFFEVCWKFSFPDL